LSSSLLVAFTSPHALMTRGSSINIRIFADDDETLCAVICSGVGLKNRLPNVVKTRAKTLS
jgi:hypothetical protein